MIKVVALTQEGRVFSSAWNHPMIADKAEAFIKRKHPNSTIYQIVELRRQKSWQMSIVRDVTGEDLQPTLDMTILTPQSNARNVREPE